MSDRVAGKVAVITGAARGQGRSHALRLAEEGADIIALDACTDIPSIPHSMATEADLEQTRKEIEALGRRIVVAKVDVRDRDGLKAAIDAGVAELGRLDIVVANAGVGIAREWDQITPELWQDTLDINLTGVWNTITLTASHLIEAGGGSIIAIGSTAALRGVPWFGPYVAAKHGVSGIVKQMANELAKHQIRVNSVNPTGVNTQFVTEGLPNIDELIGGAPELGTMFQNALPIELLEPRDVSNTVLFLASDEAAHVTGMQMKVDAGCTNS